jgi:hypothetical protein
VANFALRGAGAAAGRPGGLVGFGGQMNRSFERGMDTFAVEFEQGTRLLGGCRTRLFLSSIFYYFLLVNV